MSEQAANIAHLEGGAVEKGNVPSSENKDRVFVALYWQSGGQSQLTNGHPNAALGPGRYHWAIYIEPKAGAGIGSSFDVRFEPAANSARGHLAAHWRYSHNPAANIVRSNYMLGRLLIGKCPSNVTIANVNTWLAAIPLPTIPHPDTPAIELQNCVTWTQHAIGVLQQHGCANPFDIPQFIAAATTYGDQWQGSTAFTGNAHRTPPTINYVGRKL